MTIRFIHFGDTHLSRTYPYPVSFERVSAFNKAFQHVIDKALELDVDFIIHAGDLFDRLNPWPSVVAFVKSQIAKLEEARIPLFIIRGNHDGSFDSEGVLRGCSIELLKHPSFTTLHFVDPVYDLMRESLRDTPGYRDYLESIRIIGIGYFGHHIGKYFERYVHNALRTDKDAYILVLHTFVEGYTACPPGEPYIPLSYIESLPLTYIAVGHDHDARDPLRLRNGAIIACSGSTEKWDFYESDGKFFYLVELKGDNVARISKHAIPSPHIMTALVVESDTPRSPDWFVKEAIRRITELANSTSKKLILRIRFKGELRAGNLSDIPLHLIEKAVKRLRSSGKLLYCEITPPDLTVRLEDIKVKPEGLDIKSAFLEALKDPALAEKAYQIFDYARELYRDEDNLTRDGNLKESAMRRLKDKISSLWGVSYSPLGPGLL